MEANLQKLYSELRTIKNELLESLIHEKCSPEIAPIVEEELKDIEETLEKIEAGKFGLCECSGQLIPDAYLYMVPTIKSIEDVNEINRYYCKPIFS